MALEFRGLGTVEAWCDGHQLPLGGAKQRGLLALLMLEPNRIVGLERLLDQLWPDGRPERTTLYRLASRLRRVLADSGQDVLLSRSGGYVLAVDPAQVDLHRFERLVRDGRRELAAGNVEPAARLLAEALGLWRGSALTGVPEAVRDGAATRLEELRVLATEERIAAELALGRHEQLIPELHALVAEHPWRERLIGHLMTALNRGGQRAEALEVYGRSRRRMIDELGLEPGTELRRLQTHILTAHPEAGPDGAIPRQLPVDVPGFTGRAEALRRFDAAVDAAVVVISGMAGVGKTTLAVHAAHRAAARFPDGQLYVDLRGFDPSRQAVSAPQAVRGFLDAFAVPAERIPVDSDAQFALFRTVVAGKRILVLLDNARDAEHVRPLLAGGPGSLTIVTSRDQLTELVAAEGAHAIGLEPLDPDEGRELLDRRLGAERTGAEPEAAGDIVRLCGGLPLALAVVAARAATHPGHELKALAVEVRDARLDVLAEAGPSTDVRAVFSWSYSRLGAEPARLFRLLGLHPGPDFALPAAASLAGLSLRDTRRLLAELCRVSLLSQHVPGRYRLHDLLSVYAAELAGSHEAADELRAAQRRMLEHYLHSAHAGRMRLRATRVLPFELQTPPPTVVVEDFDDHDQALAWFTAEHAVLCSIVGYAARSGFDVHAWQLAWALGAFHVREARWQDELAVTEIGLEAARRSGEPAAEAVAHRMMAHVCTRLGWLENAHLHLEQCLALRRMLGNRSGEADAHNLLSALYSRREEYAGALEHAQIAYDLYWTIGDTRGEAIALNNVALHQCNVGDYDQALTSCRRALELKQEVGEPRSEANTWDTLGYIHAYRGEYEQAVACYQRALDVFRRFSDRYEEAETLNNLGDAWRLAGDITTARDTWQQALTIFEELGHSLAETVRAKLAS